MRGLDAVTGKGSVSAPAAVMIGVGAGGGCVTGSAGVEGAGVRFGDGEAVAVVVVACCCLSNRRRSCACTVQMSIRKRRSKKVTDKKAKKAAVSSGKNRPSTNMLTGSRLIPANPSPMDIIAMV